MQNVEETTYSLASLIKALGAATEKEIQRASIRTPSSSDSANLGVLAGHRRGVVVALSCLA